MNSDEHSSSKSFSAADAAFGMEDPSICPTAAEREQQHWIDAISAVIAVDGSNPIAPSAAIHDAIQLRIDAPVRSLRPCDFSRGLVGLRRPCFVLDYS